MPTDIERFEALKRRKADLDRRQIELETQLRSAKEQFGAKLKELEEKYNVKSLAAAKVLLAKKTEEFQAQLSQMEEALKKYESNDCMDITGV
jgi:chromosome segregation ATPase